MSRTAISKWESERGFPNIESLKALSKCFSVTLDELLSSDELMTLAQADQKQKERRIKDRIFGLLDGSMVLLLFLPFFAQNTDGIIREVSLRARTEVQPYLKTLYVVSVLGSILVGILTLVLQNCTRAFWARSKIALSLFLSAVGAVLFIVSRQPYAAVFAFVFLVIKALILLKRK